MKQHAFLKIFVTGLFFSLLSANAATPARHFPMQLTIDPGGIEFSNSAHPDRLPCQYSYYSNGFQEYGTTIEIDGKHPGTYVFEYSHTQYVNDRTHLNELFCVLGKGSGGVGVEVMSCYDIPNPVNIKHEMAMGHCYATRIRTNQ